MKRTPIHVMTVAVAALGLLAACGGDGTDANGVAALDEPASDNATDDGTDGHTNSTDGPNSTEEVDPEEAVLAFTQCMREQGVDMPDPEFSDEGGVMFSTEDDGDGDEPPPAVDLEAMDAAYEECGELMEGANLGGGEPVDMSEMEDQMLEFAQCMRDEGVDMPDPDFSGDVADERATRDPGDGSDGPVIAGPFGTLELGDPEVEAAFDACSDVLGEGAPRLPGIGGGEDG